MVFRANLLDCMTGISYFRNLEGRLGMQRRLPKKTDLSKNIIYYYAALGVVVLGYVFLMIGSANSFTSLTLGPIVLVLGYLVAIPVALLTGVGQKTDNPPDEENLR